MLEAEFQQHLRDVKRFSERTIGSRTGNCRRIELNEGDLDRHFDNDQCQRLLWRLTYSTDDQDRGRAPSHSVPINGNLRTGSATLKQAIGLYVHFRRHSNS